MRFGTSVDVSSHAAIGAGLTDGDDRLVLLCRDGDVGAFDVLVERYYERLFRFAVRTLRDRGAAEDVVQETFVRAFRAIRSYRPDGFFSSWLYRIALNEARRAASKLGRTDRERHSSSPTTAVDPQVAAIAADRDLRLREIVNGLPDHYRTVVQFYYFDGLSLNEIGRALAVSPTAVKVRLHRARARLATEMRDQGMVL